MFGDLAVLGDYDGDGKADVAVWRGGEEAGAWLIINSADGLPRARRAAASGSQPAAAKPNH